MTIEVTRMERLYLRLMLGTLRMFEQQLEQVPARLRLAALLPEPSLAAALREAVEQALADATDAPEPEPERVTTTDNSPAPAETTTV
jgi:hypothetical protein